MTYRSKCIGKRNRFVVSSLDRWLNRGGRGLHSWCRWEVEYLELGYPPTDPSARVRKRSGYKPSAERQVRVYVREWEKQFASAMRRVRLSLSMFLFGGDDEYAVCDAGAGGGIGP